MPLKQLPRVRIELTTFRLWDWRAAYCANEAQLFHVFIEMNFHGCHWNDVNTSTWLTFYIFRNSLYLLALELTFDKRGQVHVEGNTRLWIWFQSISMATQMLAWISPPHDTWQSVFFLLKEEVVFTSSEAALLPLKPAHLKNWLHGLTFLHWSAVSLTDQLLA